MKLKRLLIVGMASVLGLPVLATSFIFVHAEESNQGTTNTTTTMETEPSTKPEDVKALADRIAKHKAELKTKLNSAEKLRIQSKCKAAQGVVGSVRGRVKGIETSRSQVYKNIIDHLTKLSEKLKDKGVNTDTLNADIAVLQGKIDTFNTDLAAYKQAVSDLADMDCKTDPDGFKAALEAARAARQKTNQDGQAVRSYISDTIKPLLKTIRAELEANKPEGSN